MCETHNHVNRELGKPEFDCNKVEERWSRLFKAGAAAVQAAPPIRFEFPFGFGFFVCVQKLLK
jgi:hypothetical protein